MEQSLSIELTESNLAEYLAGIGLIDGPEQVRVRQLTGGVSNNAFWVDGPREPCVVKQARPRLDAIG